MESFTQSAYTLGEFIGSHFWVCFVFWPPCAIAVAVGLVVALAQRRTRP